MKQTSSLRRIDELGRVVIPKEIREKLYLKFGSIVLVESEDEKIIITNHQKLESLGFLAERCVNSFGKEWKVLICDTKKVLASNFSPKNSEKLFEKLLERKNVVLYNQNVLNILDNIKTQAIFPLISQGDLFGGLVLMSEKFVQDFSFAEPIKNLLCLSLEN